MEEEFKIKVGNFVIVQRQAFTKLHKVKAHGTMNLGKFTVEMDNIVGQRFCDTFEMKKHEKNKKLYTLEKVTKTNTHLKTTISIEKSGTDNRHIMPDGNIQALTKDDIDKFTEDELKSNKIVEHLINNSKTFNMKTEYSQAKYIKKKEKKYFEYVEIRKPTIRVLANMYYRQDRDKILNLRIDDLSQILMYANIQGGGNHLLYDSGTCGLLTAAVMNSIGSDTTGHLIHMHPGNECQKNAFYAMGFAQEQRERCLNVNVYSVLRYFYQNKAEYSEKSSKKTENKIDESKNEKENSENQEEPPIKKARLAENQNASIECSKKGEKDHESTEIQSNETENQEETPESLKDITLEENPNASVENANQNPEKEYKKPQWHYENLRACKILEKQCESLIIATKDHPLSFVKELIPFLKGGRQLVVYHILKEPLVELYNYLKSRLDFVMIRITDNFLRHYQVLPERTHPEVMMTSGGFILSAIKLNS